MEDEENIIATELFRIIPENTENIFGPYGPFDKYKHTFIEIKPIFKTPVDINIYIYSFNNWFLYTTYNYTNIPVYIELHIPEYNKYFAVTSNQIINYFSWKHY